MCPPRTHRHTLPHAHTCPHTHTHTRPGTHRHTLTRTHVPAWAHTLVHISRQLTASPRCATLRLCLDCARDPRGLGRFAPWGSDAPFPAPSGDSHSPVRREQHKRGALGADSALWSLVVWPPARGSRSAPRIRAPSAPASAADPGRAAPARRPRGLGRRFICFSVNRADCFAVCLRFPPGNIGGEEPDAPPWAERQGTGDRRGPTRGFQAPVTKMPYSWPFATPGLDLSCPFSMSLPLRGRLFSAQATLSPRLGTPSRKHEAKRL